MTENGSTGRGGQQGIIELRLRRARFDEAIRRTTLQTVASGSGASLNC